METQVAVPLKTEQFVALVDFLREHDDARDPVIAIWEAIDYWMDNASWKPELLRASMARGFQWKTLFLPEGTELRMQYKGKYHYAKVEGDQLMYEGDAISPGALANAIAGSSRNAWRDLWVKRPRDTEWHLADDIRGGPRTREQA